MKSALISVSVSLLLAFMMFSSPGIAHTESTPAAELSEIQAMFRTGQVEEALERAQALLVTVTKTPNPELEFQTLRIIIAAHFSLNRYSPKVFEYELRQEQIALELNDAERIAGVRNNIAYDLLVTGKAPLQEAIARLVSANEYYAKAEQNDGRWYTLMNLTWAYRHAGELDTSRDYGELAVATAQRLDDRHAIIETHLNLAETHLEMGNLNEAQQHVNAAKVQAVKAEDRDRFVFNVYQAHFQLIDGKTQEAIESLKAAIHQLQSLEQFYAELGRSVLARAYLAEQRWQEAEQAADHILANKVGYIPREAWVHAVITKASVLHHKGAQRQARQLLTTSKNELDGFGSPTLNKQIDQALSDLSAD